MKYTGTLILTFLMFMKMFSQVGINTTTPKSTLDVNGDLALRKALSVGGTDVVNGDKGSVDQVLVSKGAGQPPVWRYANIPFMENSQYKLINTYLKTDQTGITTLSNSVAASSPVTSNLNEDFDPVKWVKISDLSIPVEIKASQNKITYQVQSGVELVNKVAGSGSSVNFICGIFKNDKLVALRPDGITAIDTAPTQSIFTLNYTEENVPIGNYTVDVACRKISSSDVTNNYFRIGVNIPTYGPTPILTNTSSNAFSLRSLLKIDIAELVTYTN